MTAYLRWGGAALLVVCAILVGREYKKYTEKRLAEGEGILALARHAEGRIEKYLTPRRGLWVDFRCDALSSSALLRVLSEDGSSGDGILSAVSALSVGKEAKAALGELLSGLGKGYKSEAIALCRKTDETLGKILESEREELPRRARAFCVLLLAVALGATILLV